MRIVLNARFATRPMTGVDRVASELMRACLSDDWPGPGHTFQALHPPGPITLDADHPLRGVLCPFGTALPGALWEQTVLPYAARGALVLNLCNMSPILSARSLLMVHDAQTRDVPGAYSWPFRLWYRLLQPMAARRAVIRLTVSQHAAQRLRAHCIAPEWEVCRNGADHILHHPPDPQALARFQLEHNGYLLGLASDAAHKNTAFLLRAYEQSRLAQPLVLVGAVQTALPPNVRCLGRVSDPELRALYQGALAFLFPSQTEGFGLPPLEAMLCGCPTVVSDRGALPEISGGGGWVVPVQSTQTWADTMRRLAQDPALRRQLRERGLTHAKAATWVAAAAQFQDCVARALSECSEPKRRRI